MYLDILDTVDSFVNIILTGWEVIEAITWVLKYRQATKFVDHPTRSKDATWQG